MDGARALGFLFLRPPLSEHRGTDGSPATSSQKCDLLRSEWVSLPRCIAGQTLTSSPLSLSLSQCRRSRSRPGRARVRCSTLPFSSSDLPKCVRGGGGAPPPPPTILLLLLLRHTDSPLHNSLLLPPWPPRPLLSWKMIAVGPKLEGRQQQQRRRRRRLQWWRGATEVAGDHRHERG